MLDRKGQAVVAAAVADAVGAEARAVEDPVEEDRAEAASEIVVLFQEVEVGEVVVAEEAAGVAEEEAEGAEASRSVHTLCLFRSHASIATKEELVRASLGGSTLQTHDIPTCLIHISCSTTVPSAQERSTHMI